MLKSTVPRRLYIWYGCCCLDLVLGIHCNWIYLEIFMIYGSLISTNVSRFTDLVLYMRALVVRITHHVEHVLPISSSKQYFNYHFSLCRDCQNIMPHITAFYSKCTKQFVDKLYTMYHNNALHIYKVSGKNYHTVSAINKINKILKAFEYVRVTLHHTVFLACIKRNNHCVV